MGCSDNKKIYRIQNLDRVSQLPDPIILSILSRLPLEDSARASILSKTWKNYCRLYPVLYFDHNLFALQSLASATEVGGGEPDFSQLREMFMDDVDHRLTSARHLDSPIRKLALNVAFNDSTSSIAYEFPASMLTSKHLRKISIRGCKLGCDPISRFWLERLCLSHVVMDYDALENLTIFCQGIETLILENCSVEMIKFLNLSKFPNLKKVVIGIQCGELDYIDIVDTNLECITCDAQTELCVSAAACASIKEIDCAWCTFDQPTLLKDFTSTFPLLEEGCLQIHDTNTFKAANNLLRKLILLSNDNDFACVKEVYIDCPSLIYFDCWTKGLEELHLNCPKLREFNFAGTTVPKRVLCSSMTALEKSSWNIVMRDAYDTTWLMNLREFIVPLIGNQIANGEYPVFFRPFHFLAFIITLCS
ncbi:F-box/FBD/LRR-repeat protein At3g52680-like [Silene latifolia]|uniref:F-box/FBD/LRR-repeat protein At3g52680-like n=1 Tax=Silene latifolia TaxID=37657 RepID=UPI003D76CAFC